MSTYNVNKGFCTKNPQNKYIYGKRFRWNDAFLRGGDFKACQ